MQPAPIHQAQAQLIYACEGLEVRLHPCPGGPDHFKLELLTPDSRYEYGDYPTEEAHQLAKRLIESRKAWEPANSGGFWLPEIWQTREWDTGRIEFWRRGPGGSELCVSQPHGRAWHMYWGTLPVVRDQQDLGVFDTHFEAMGALEKLAANDMKGAVVD